MITWIEIVDVSDVSGDAVGVTAGTTYPEFDDFFYLDQPQRFVQITENWSAGNYETKETWQTTFPDFLFEDIETLEPFDDGFFATWPRQILSFSASNGTQSATLVEFRGTFEESVGLITDGPFPIATVYPIDNNWSRRYETIPSYDYETLSNQTGRTTATESIFLQAWTTSQVGGMTSFVQTQLPTIKTTTTGTNTFTRLTWSENPQETFYVTGETTVKKYSSFSNAVPLFVGGSVLQTAEETQQISSFKERSGYADGYESEATISRHTQGFGEPPNTTATRTTNGFAPTISNSAPTTTSFGSRVTTTSIPREPSPYSLGQTDTTFNAEPDSEINIFIRSSDVLFVGGSIYQTFTETETYDVQPNSKKTYVSFFEEEDVETFTATGGHFLEAEVFSTQVIGSVDAVNSINIGVRAISNGPIGAGIEAGGIGNVFSTHDLNVLLAVSKQSEGTLWSANSRIEGTAINQYGVVGQSQSQWSQVTTISDIQQSAITMLGGALRGEAIIKQGVYRTYAGNDEGVLFQNIPTLVSWSAGDLTTALVKATTLQTFTGTDVSSVSRHQVTEVIDD